MPSDANHDWGTLLLLLEYYTITFYNYHENILKEEKTNWFIRCGCH